MAAVLDDGRYDAHVERIAAWRGRSRRLRYAIYFVVAALIAWSIEAIVVGDTDWNRLSWEGVFKAAGRFIADRTRRRPAVIPTTTTASSRG